MPLQTLARPRAGMAFSGRPPMPRPAPRSSVGAFLDGFQDDLTFGLGDQFKAGTGALYDAYNGIPVSQAYWRRIGAEHDLDRLDSQQQGTARSWGKGVGTALQLAAGGGLGAMARGGVHMAEVTPLIMKEISALGGAGAVVGAGTRAVVDRWNGRQSSWGDLAAAGLGGGLEALLSRTGNPGRAGAIAGGATSITEDVLNGRAPSWRRAYEAAGQGGFLGAGLGVAGRRLSNSLPSSAREAGLSKENLGEWASMARTRLRGERTVTRKKTREYLSDGRWTFPDQRTSGKTDLVESKFGWKDTLKRRQKQARNEFGPRYRVDHVIPDDVGSVLAYPAVQLEYDVRDNRDPDRKRRSKE